VLNGLEIAIRSSGLPRVRRRRTEARRCQATTLESPVGPDPRVRVAIRFALHKLAIPVEPATWKATRRAMMPSKGALFGVQRHLF